MNAKNIIVSLLLVVLGGVITYVATKMYSSSPNADTVQSTSKNNPIPYASSATPTTENTERYESCNTSVDCIPVGVKQIVNPQKKTMQCLNNRILSDYPDYKLSEAEVNETLTEATCDCQQNYCGFTLK